MHNCPYVWEADTHLWLQNKRVFAAVLGRTSWFFLPCSEASHFFSGFWSVKLQYILSFLFYFQITLSFSYLPPLPKYISSFYLQHFNMEGGSVLGFSWLLFFFQCGVFLFCRAHRSAVDHSNIWSFLSIWFIIILMTSGSLLSQNSKPPGKLAAGWIAQPRQT